MQAGCRPARKFNAERRKKIRCLGVLTFFKQGLINVRKQFGSNGIGQIFGQEKNITTYNLARMNMLLHGVKDSEFQIHHGDSLLNDWNILNEMNPAKKCSLKQL